MSVSSHYDSVARESQLLITLLHRSFIEFIFFTIRRVVDDIIPDAPEVIIVPYDVIVETRLPAKLNFGFIAPFGDR